MTIVEWATIFAAIGTISATAVAAYSAHLAWKHVRYQFEPRLIITPASFQIRVAADSIDKLWWEPPSDEARYVNGGSCEYFFEIMNIGNGPAHGISARAEFDYETVYRDVMEKIATHKPGLELQNDGFGCQVKLNSKIIGGFRLPDEAAGYVDFLPNTDRNKSTARLIIDPNLSFFALCYASYLMHEKIQNNVAQPALSIPVAFRLAYRDSSGKRVERRVRCNLTIRGGRWKNDLSDGVAMISLESLE